MIVLEKKSFYETDLVKWFTCIEVLKKVNYVIVGKLESCKLEPCKFEPCKLEPCKLEPCKLEPCKLEPCKLEPCNTGSSLEMFLRNSV